MAGFSRHMGAKDRSQKLKELLSRFQRISPRHACRLWGVSGTPWTKTIGQQLWYVTCLPDKMAFYLEDNHHQLVSMS